MVTDSGAEPGLLSALGRELLDRVSGLELGPDEALALGTALRAEYPASLVAAALTQQALRIAGRAKFSQADRMLFTRPGLEQASSELTARHAAARLADANLIADLCCGIGGNLIALAAPPPPEPGGPGAGAREPGARAAGARTVIGVDRDLPSLEFARHNVGVYAPEAAAAYVCADVREFGLGGVDAVFIDPARRDPRGRLPAGHYQPDLTWCLELAGRVPAVGIKAAPGLRRDLVPAGWETEFVAVGRELKEALLWSPVLAGTRSRATVLRASGETPDHPANRTTGPAGTANRAIGSAGTANRTTGPAGTASWAAGLMAGDTLIASGEGVQAPLGAPGEFLFDPNPAVTRAGLVAELAQLLGAWQIDPMIAFLSADRPASTPFARTLRVLESAPWHEKRFGAKLRELGIGTIDLRRRGLAGDVDLIRKRLRAQGPGAATVVLTRVSDRPWGLVCVPVPAGPGAT
jgi:hypothetical protein